jgi:hypothetical protein
MLRDLQLIAVSSVNNIIDAMLQKRKKREKKKVEESSTTFIILAKLL